MRIMCIWIFMLELNIFMQVYNLLMLNANAVMNLELLDSSKCDQIIDHEDYLRLNNESQHVHKCAEHVRLLCDGFFFNLLVLVLFTWVNDMHNKIPTCESSTKSENVKCKWYLLFGLAVCNCDCTTSER